MRTVGRLALGIAFLGFFGALTACVSATHDVHRTGVGPATISVVNPSKAPDNLSGPRHFLTTFTCSSGQLKVYLRQDKGIHEGGPCGGSTGYDMPLPSNVGVYTFRIMVAPKTTWTFDGDFSPSE